LNATLNRVLEGLEPEFARLAGARHPDPFALLGPHRRQGRLVVVVYLPGAARARLEGRLELRRWKGGDFFAWTGPTDALPARYRVRWEDGRGGTYEVHDPYCFPPQLPDDALARFNAGHGDDAARWLGAHAVEADGVRGVRFAVWAPNAQRVAVVGPFNLWDGRRHPMRLRIGTGVWELFVPGVEPGDLYKFEVLGRDAHTVDARSDPFGRRFELRPASAAIVEPSRAFEWRDAAWLERRARRDWAREPLSVYEVHLGSWRRGPQGFRPYRELAPELAEHCRAHGFTHVELLPVTEHPHDDSWGYQCTGFFAPTSRHGTPDDFRWFVDELHARGIGVILDWVPGHFPKDAHALARFDGTPTYEYADWRKAEHREWGTLVFDYARHEVRSFLLASARTWIEEFHVDGLRVDAVASMLHLDYARPAGEWAPNEHGGRENLEAIAFLQALNAMVGERFPGVLTIAEESTTFPGVTRAVADGGLGFALKWNMGWMHDTLAYFREDPLHRRHHHERLTFGLTYQWSERFLLPFSHDEVVHLKRSLLGRMPGDDWQRYANLRLLYAWQWTHPGPKLLFMGGELAQPTEWNHLEGLPWWLLEDPRHAGISRLVADLNALYRRLPALHARDLEAEGFRWLDCDDRDHSRLAFERRAGTEVAVVVLNFTPVPRERWRVGLPRGGAWREALNTDSAHYGGANLGNLAAVRAERVPAMGREWSAEVLLPPLGAVVLVPETRKV
jgi:1,4-alpha-glucan branching enzyme